MCGLLLEPQNTPFGTKIWLQSIKMSKKGKSATKKWPFLDIGHRSGDDYETGFHLLPAGHQGTSSFGSHLNLMSVLAFAIKILSKVLKSIQK